jgi:hypothetical protein
VFAKVENLAHFAAGDFADAGELEREDVHAHCEMPDAGRLVEQPAR